MRLMISAAVVITIWAGSCLATNGADEYTCDIAFSRNMTSVEHNGSLTMSLFISRSANDIDMLITNSVLNVVQKVNDINITNNLPSNIVVRGRSGALAAIDGKNVHYVRKGSGWSLESDGTRGNQVIGPLSGLLDFLVVETNQLQQQVLGFDIIPVSEVTVSNCPPYEVKKRLLNDPITGETGSQEIAIIGTVDRVKYYSWILLTNDVTTANVCIKKVGFDISP